MRIPVSAVTILTLVFATQHAKSQSLPVAHAAVEAFERVLSADPAHARAHFWLGKSYHSAGDYEKGKEYLQKFIEMAPDDPEVPGAREMLSYLE